MPAQMHAAMATLEELKGGQGTVQAGQDKVAPSTELNNVWNEAMGGWNRSMGESNKSKVGWKESKGVSNERPAGWTT